jgi:dolichol-phosphate mannosyltransferase
MLKLAMDGIISFSSKPLKLIEYIGFGTILISLVLLAYSLIIAFSSSEVTILGSSLILVLLIFLGGIQLLSIGIVGEYIARIYDESKGRPLYVIDREIHLEESPVKPIHVVENAASEPDNLQNII